MVYTRKWIRKKFPKFTQCVSYYVLKSTNGTREIKNKGLVFTNITSLWLNHYNNGGNCMGGGGEQACCKVWNFKVEQPRGVEKFHTNPWSCLIIRPLVYQDEYSLFWLAGILRNFRQRTCLLPVIWSFWLGILWPFAYKACVLSLSYISTYTQKGQK